MTMTVALASPGSACMTAERFGARCGAGASWEQENNRTLAPGYLFADFLADLLFFLFFVGGVFPARTTRIL